MAIAKDLFVFFLGGGLRVADVMIIAFKIHSAKLNLDADLACLQHSFMKQRLYEYADLS